MNKINNNNKIIIQEVCLEEQELGKLLDLLLVEKVYLVILIIMDIINKINYHLNQLSFQLVHIHISNWLLNMDGKE